MQLTLKYKFMLPTLFLFTLCLGAATAFSFLRSHDALETAYTGQVVSLANNTAHKLEAWLSDHERALVTWAGHDNTGAPHPRGARGS